MIQGTGLGGITALPALGGYAAPQGALQGLPPALAQEVAPFGIRVPRIEPGGYAPDWVGPSPRRSPEHPAYDGVRATESRSWADRPGDPRATRGAILKVVDADEPPLRIFFGRAPLAIATADYESRLATWNAWQPVSVEAYGV